MKKAFFGIILFILLAGCASKPAGSDGMTLDKALKEAAVRIEERIPAGAKIAPLNFNSPHDKFTFYVLDELSANLVESRKLIVVDRKEIDLIRREFDFQLSDEVSDDSMQALGQMLGAQSIVSGTLTEIGGDYRIMIRVLNVQNASVEAQYRTDIVNDKRVAALLTGGKTAATAAAPKQTPSGGSGTAQVPTQTPVASPTAPAAQVPAQTPTAQTPAVPAAAVIAIEVTAQAGGKLYFQDKEVATLWDNETHTIPIEGPGTYALKMVFATHTESRAVVINTRGITKVSFGGIYTLGQTGPAGGFVFFDKGSYSDGWRYLEAASTDVAGTAEWGAYEKNIGGTNTGRGAGKRNTQLIVNYLRDTSETGRAAQLTQEFRQGGYDDWFLPSKDELNLMYENLKQKGLGRFQNARYWSSSESGSGSAWNQNFDNGNQSSGSIIFNYIYKNEAMTVRAIRQF